MDRLRSKSHVQKVIRTYPSNISEGVDSNLGSVNDLQCLLSDGWEVVMCNAISCTTYMTYKGINQTCLEYILQREENIDYTCNDRW